MFENYIFSYYQKIKDGTITAGKWVIKWYEQVIAGLEKRAYIYDAKKAAAAIVFVENYCRHHEGTLGGQKIRLELWQKAFLSVVFGIVDEGGARQFREVVLIVGRKNGKTLLNAAIAAYHVYLDGEYGARVYFAAPKLEQASLCFSAFQQMIEKEPMLDRMAKKRHTDIYFSKTNSSAKPIPFSCKKSDGLNVSLGICDEISSWVGDPGLKFYEVLKSSQGARRQPLLLSISTAGFTEGGIYDELITRSTRALLGESKETRLAPFLYIVDDPQKWNDINELQKSNPNLGVSVSVDYMLEEIAIAEGSLSKKSEFLTKYCNHKQTSSMAWLPAEAVRKCIGAPLRFEDYKECYAVCGVDLSRTTDLSSVTCVVERDGVLNVFAQFYLPAERLEEATARDGLPYKIFAEKGWLKLSGDNVVDYHDAEQWLTDLLRKYKIYPLQTGYDRYSAAYLIQDLQKQSFHVDDVYQGYNLTPVINELYGMICDGRVNIGDNDLLKIHLLNAAMKYDGDTERVKLVKISKNAHVDGTAALLDAICVRQKYASQIGRQLENKRRS